MRVHLRVLGTVSAEPHFQLFRRAKLWLDGVPATVLAAAVGAGLLVGRLGLTESEPRPRTLRKCTRVSHCRFKFEVGWKSSV